MENVLVTLVDGRVGLETLAGVEADLSLLVRHIDALEVSSSSDQIVIKEERASHLVTRQILKCGRNVDARRNQIMEIKCCFRRANVV